MKLIIGLGNPGKEYELTRHNAGFLAIDAYLEDTTTINCTSKFKAQICEMHRGSTKLFFIKPQTFMNESGTAVLDLVQYYKLNPKRDILIIHDEIDLPLGTVRYTASSSPAGHNGVKDIFEKLGTKDIQRVRIGIETRESRERMPTEAFVLRKFSDNELAQLKKDSLPDVSRYIDEFIGR